MGTAMRNPWKTRQPDGAEMWDKAQREAWEGDEADRLLFWRVCLPTMWAALVLGAIATCGALGWLG